MRKSLALCAGVLILCAQTGQATELDISYHSKYVSEGRNQLSSGGIYWLFGSQNLSENLVLSLAYGIAEDTSADYDELNVLIEYSGAVGDVNYTVGYNRLEFFRDDLSDNEFSLALTYQLVDTFMIFSNSVYSTEVRGSYVDFGGEKALQINENLSLNPYLLVAYDFGYASQQDEGYNHTALGASLSFTLSERIAIRGFIEKSFGGTIIKAETSNADQLFAGVHVAYSW